MTSEALTTETASNKRPPGPSDWGALTNLRRIIFDRISFIEDMAKYGDVSRAFIAGLPVYFVNDPALIQRILVTDYKKFPKSRGYDVLAQVVGQGILTSGGDFHKSQRKMIQPSFTAQRVPIYAAAMTDHTARMCEKWEDGQEVNMADQMMRLTLNIIAKTLFDTDAEEDAELVQETLESFFDIMHNFEGPFGPLYARMKFLPKHRHWLQQRDKLDELIYRIIEQHQKDGGDKGDVLSKMIEAVDDDGKPMAVKQLRDEAITLFLAGHETTALAMSWTWMLLSQNPQYMEELQNELDRELGGRPATVDDLDRLVYTRMVMSESMRLYPPAYAVDRTPLEDYDTGDFIFKKGSFVVMSQWSMHRHPEYWPDPERFDPWRWTEEETAKRPKFAYFPFGGGPRVCIGEGFAWMEAIIILATLAQHWTPELKPGYTPELQPLVTLRPKGGMPMTLHKRSK